MILVTGGAGFIGSHLVRRLVRDGRAVAVLTRKTSDLSRIKDLLPGLAMLYDDLTDAERLKKLLGETGIDGVFHCAASNIKSGVAAPEDDLIKTNVAGTVHLIRALEGIDYKFFINSGSLLEYGAKEHPPRETDVCEPIEIYALTKLAATLFCQAMARASGKPIVTFRIFSPYGPGMEGGRLVYEVVRRALNNEEIKLTRPEVNRDFIYIDDLVDLYVEAMHRAETLKGEIFNLGSGKAVTLQELADITLALTGSRSAVQWGGAKDVAYDKACWQADMNKTLSAFNWRPVYDIDAGIKRMIEWVMLNDKKRS